MDYQKVGLLIAALRKEKGLTQKELADKLGITDRAVSKWERGLGCPDISLLDDLSKILDISILEILKGRRLDKDEIINNKSVVESMNYSKESIKYKFKKIFNAGSICIIGIICLMLIFFNLKSIYLLNKTYHIPSYDRSDIYLFDEIENNIETIRNNQGIYSDNDYKEILKHLNRLEINLRKQNNLYYFNKTDYKYTEIMDFYKSHQEYLYLEDEGPLTLNSKIYDIVHKYNLNVVNNMIGYSDYTRSLIGSYFNISELLQYPYYNNKNISNDNILNIVGFINGEYCRDNMLLKDIIEVGEMHE